MDDTPENLSNYALLLLPNLSEAAVEITTCNCRPINKMSELMIYSSVIFCGSTNH